MNKKQLQKFQINFQNTHLTDNTIVKHPICWNLELLAVSHHHISCPQKVIDATLHPNWETIGIVIIKHLEVRGSSSEFLKEQNILSWHHYHPFLHSKYFYCLTIWFRDECKRVLLDTLWFAWILHPNWETIGIVIIMIIYLTSLSLIYAFQIFICVTIWFRRCVRRMLLDTLVATWPLP